MDHNKKNWDLFLGLILIITSKAKIIIGTIISSFSPSEINFVMKFANKKYPNNIEMRLIDFDLQLDSKEPKNNFEILSLIIENLVFCIL